jgi:wyosine [tRNA(Phe)-imidazoG37] synthetase (radical SAM superfamily)
MDWNTLYRPSINVTRSEYLEKLRELFDNTRKSTEKLILEVVVARQGAENIFTDYLNDYFMLIRRLKVRKVLLKTIDRPVRQSNLKPVSRQSLERLNVRERGFMGSNLS